MTIKKRFLISYIGGIAIAWAALFAIIGIVFYVTAGEIPTPSTLYKTFTKQRSLSPEEELAYVKLRSVAKSEPDQLLSDKETLKTMIHQFEKDSLGVVIRKKQDITYYSKDLVEKSLIVHFPKFDENNLETRGTIDNAGRLYRYIKFDFYYSDKTPGSILVLKKESNFLEFMTKWGIAIIVVILLISIGGLLFLNHLLKRAVITPLENLGDGMAEIKQGHLDDTTMEMNNQTATEVKQLTSDFEEMRAALIYSNEERHKLENNRKELIASISHDLKTPITSVIGYVEGLLDGVVDSPEKQEKYLQTIHAKALSLDHLIEELFLYSKLDAAAIPFEFEKINIKDFLNHVTEEFQLTEQSVFFQIVRGNTAPIYIMGDRIQLNRVFSNLIENSIKFKKTDQQLEIRINIFETSETVTIYVTDNGQGIAANQLPNIFDHFYRGEEARPTKTGGSGLGLAIVKQIIDAHGGKVSVTSTLNEGTTVATTLAKA